METWMNERDACGIGAVINIDGKADNKVLDDALSIVEKLEHRAGKDATGKVGDGVGILVQISHKFFSKEAKKDQISCITSQKTVMMSLTISQSSIP